MLRVESILRRVSAPLLPTAAKLQIGEISLDSDTHRVTVGGQPIDLTATEFSWNARVGFRPANIFC